MPQLMLFQGLALRVLCQHISVMIVHIRTFNPHTVFCLFQVYGGVVRRSRSWYAYPHLTSAGISPFCTRIDWRCGSWGVVDPLFFIAPKGQKSLPVRLSWFHDNLLNVVLLRALSGEASICFIGMTLFLEYEPHWASNAGCGFAGVAEILLILR